MVIVMELRPNLKSHLHRIYQVLQREVALCDFFS